MEGYDDFLKQVKSFNHSICLYEFFIYSKNRNGNVYEDIIGWLVESQGRIVLAQLCKTRKGVNYEKRQSALDFCKKLLEEEIN